jgi:hypothetical protein
MIKTKVLLIALKKKPQDGSNLITLIEFVVYFLKNNLI